MTANDCCAHRAHLSKSQRRQPNMMAACCCRWLQVLHVHSSPSVAKRTRACPCGQTKGADGAVCARPGEASVAAAHGCCCCCCDGSCDGSCEVCCEVCCEACCDVGCEVGCGVVCNGANISAGRSREVPGSESLVTWPPSTAARLSHDSRRRSRTAEGVASGSEMFIFEAFSTNHSFNLTATCNVFPIFSLNFSNSGAALAASCRAWSMRANACWASIICCEPIGMVFRPCCRRCLNSSSAA
mmetsp:Transcript_34682/g.95580  ORF Transcript_34682/g.95580 Transcript_34682/m.95580 type:complete len:242 (+) Transcript_34682:504-1229(+)